MGQVSKYLKSLCTPQAPQSHLPINHPWHALFADSSSGSAGEPGSVQTTERFLRVETLSLSFCPVVSVVIRTRAM